MRASCETCAQLQPPDWQPGDLCGNCGSVVRREKRCHWCVRLTPEGKYCRHCGAGLVPDARYGAARWLKHLGTDQFALPERLAAMDPEQAEHFERLYQRHAIVAERHLDDRALAETHLRQRGWAQALENELLPRLPLSDDELTALSLAPLRGTTDTEKLLEIRQTSPFELTRQLAGLARLRLWQASDAAFTTNEHTDLELTERALAASATDVALRTEAALALSHWRLVTWTGPLPVSGVESALYAAPPAPTLDVAVAVALALLASRKQRQPQPVPAAALGAEDPDLAFAVALAQHAPAPLLAALRVPTRRFAAATLLTRLGVDFALAPLLPHFNPDQTSSLLYLLEHQARPRPDLRAFLSAVAAPDAEGKPGRGHSQAVTLLSLDLRPGDAARLVREHADSTLITRILRTPDLAPAEIGEVCGELVALDLFNPSQLSVLTELLQAGTLPAGLVPNTLRTAPSTSMFGLAAVARWQLANFSGSEARKLGGFLRATRWDAALPLPTRRLAQSLLETWQQGDERTGRPPLALTETAASAYYGSLSAYLTDLVFGLEHFAVLRELEADYLFLRPLETAAQPAQTHELLPALAALPPALVARLRAALLALAPNPTPDWQTRRSAIQLLVQLRRHAPWQAELRAELTALAATIEELGLTYLLAE